MNKTRLIVAGSVLALLPLAVLAQSVAEISELGPEERRAYMQSMSAEERDAMREQWRAELDAMPAEERAAIRERMRANRPGAGDRAAMRERLSSMSDEEREAFRARRMERKAERRERWASMSDEERAAARERMGRHKGKRPHRAGPNPGGPGADSE